MVLHKKLLTVQNKVDSYIKKYDKTRYLSLFHSKKFDKIFDRVSYLIRLKSNISGVYSRNTKIKIDSDDDLPLEKKNKYA